MPKRTGRQLSPEEIKQANAEHDRRLAETVLDGHGAGRRWRDGRKGPTPEEAERDRRRYEAAQEAHEKRLAELGRLADPQCSKCQGKGYTFDENMGYIAHRGNELGTRITRIGVSMFSFPYKRPCSCVVTDEM